VARLRIPPVVVAAAVQRTARSVARTALELEVQAYGLWLEVDTSEFWFLGCWRSYSELVFVELDKSRIVVACSSIVVGVCASSTLQPSAASNLLLLLLRSVEGNRL